MPELKTPPKAPKYKRSWRNLIINRAYQFKYIFWLSGSGVALCAGNSLMFYLFMRENYRFLVELSPMTDEAKAQLYSELTHIVLYVFSGSILFLLAVSAVGLIFSHRTAGPLYHFKRVFGEIRNGKFSNRVRLRPGDDFKDVALAFNEMMDRMEAELKSKATGR